MKPLFFLWAGMLLLAGGLSLPAQQSEVPAKTEASPAAEQAPAPERPPTVKEAPAGEESPAAKEALVADETPALSAPPAPPAPIEIRPIVPRRSGTELSESIRSVLENPEFSWRLPRVNEKKAEVGPGPLDGLWSWIKAKLRPAWHWLKPYWDKIQQKIKNWVKSWNLKEEEKPRLPAPTDWMGWIRTILYALAAASMLALAWFYLRHRNRFRATGAAVSMMPIAVIPNLEDESASAGDLPADEWIRLARQLAGEGKLRPASRAIYLATLAVLEQHELIRTARAKSNGDYFREVSRRSAGRREVVDLLGDTIGRFERGWYGSHEVTSDGVEALVQNCSKIRGSLEN